ncbi:MAG TPA: class I SAM-dependent methyltransferase [Cyclobacteriaceae bacterium]|jgi:ubiquinone/menaquinone biosynthesis C-methylase UbiE
MNPNETATGLSGFQTFFSSQASFRQWEGLFYQSGTGRRDFEREYTALRTVEGRMLPDVIVKTLPRLPRQHALHREWKVRERSAKSLSQYLKKKKPKTVLEVGCGNGWLTNFLASQLQADCCGIDVNEIELKQAVRLFSTNERVTFVYGDIESEAFNDCTVDVIVCASVIQYFRDVRLLIDRLKRMLNSGGELHIMDSPIYNECDMAAAKVRSEDHFRNSGYPGMVSYYHHHTWEALKGYRYSVLHNPNSLQGRIKKWMGFSPFPWIVIR